MEELTPFCTANLAFLGLAFAEVVKFASQLFTHESKQQDQTGFENLSGLWKIKMNARKIIKLVGIGLLGIVGLVVVLVVGLFVSTNGSYSVPATVADDPTLPSVTIDGVTFHAETFGDSNNPVVVVVHGGPGGDYGYLLNLRALSDDYFVVFMTSKARDCRPAFPPKR